MSAGIGAAAGSGVGMLANPGRRGQNRAKNVIIGGALGGLLGAGTGYLAQELTNKTENDTHVKDNQDEQKGSNYSSKSGNPVLIPPRVESRFWRGFMGFFENLWQFNRRKIRAAFKSN